MSVGPTQQEPLPGLEPTVYLSSYWPSVHRVMPAFSSGLNAAQAPEGVPWYLSWPCSPAPSKSGLSGYHTTSARLLAALEICNSRWASEFRACHLIYLRLRLNTDYPVLSVSHSVPSFFSFLTLLSSCCNGTSVIIVSFVPRSIASDPFCGSIFPESDIAGFHNPETSTSVSFDPQTRYHVCFADQPIDRVLRQLQHRNSATTVLLYIWTLAAATYGFQRRGPLSAVTSKARVK